MRRFAFLFLFFIATACAQNVTTSPTPKFAFWEKSPLSVNVAEIVFANNFSPPMAKPNVDHLFPVSPASAVQVWQKDRLKTTGSSGRLIVRVIDASVIEKALPTATGLEGLIFNDPDTEYEGTLVVSFELDHPEVDTIANAKIRLNHNIQMAKWSTIQDREEAWVTMTEGLIAELDRLAPQVLGQELGLMRALYQDINALDQTKSNNPISAKTAVEIVPAL